MSLYIAILSKRVPHLQLSSLDPLEYFLDQIFQTISQHLFLAFHWYFVLLAEELLSQVSNCEFKTQSDRSSIRKQVVT